MAKTFKFVIVSPESQVFSAEVENVVLPGFDGYMTIMAEHAPMIVQLIPGFIDIEGKADQGYFILGGFAHIQNDKLVVIAQDVIERSSLTKEWIDSHITKTKEALLNISTDTSMQAIQQRNRMEDFLHQLTTVHGVFTLA